MHRAYLIALLPQTKSLILHYFLISNIDLGRYFIGILSITEDAEDHSVCVQNRRQEEAFALYFDIEFLSNDQIVMPFQAPFKSSSDKRKTGFARKKKDN